MGGGMQAQSLQHNGEPRHRHGVHLQDHRGVGDYSDEVPPWDWSVAGGRNSRPEIPGQAPVQWSADGAVSISGGPASISGGGAPGQNAYYHQRGEPPPTFGAHGHVVIVPASPPPSATARSPPSPALASTLRGGGVLHAPAQPYFGARITVPAVERGAGGDAKQRYAEELREQVGGEDARHRSSTQALNPKP